MSAQPAHRRIGRPARTYPLPRPATDGPDDDQDEDPRFSYGLVLDIADVLVRHGYPSPGSGDWAHLMLALHHTLYAPAPGNHHAADMTETS